MRIIVELFLLAFAVGLTVEVIKSAIPYLPLIWFVIAVYYTWKTLTYAPILFQANRIKTKLSPGMTMISYVFIAVVGAGMFMIYWWGLNSFFAPKIAAYESEQHTKKPQPEPIPKPQRPEPPPQATRQPEKTQPETKLTPQPRPTSPPPAQLKQKDADAGLTFREVPPEKLGYKRTIPDNFTIEYGTNKSTFPTILLKKQVPIERLIGIKTSGDLPLRIYFDEDGNMKIDATIYENRDKVGAVIKSGDFAVINSAWDRNWDSIAFEVVDDRRNPIFQIERLNWNFIKIGGVLITSAGDVFAIIDNSLIINPTGPVVPPKRLFQYPGNAHLHQRVAN